MKVQVEGDSRKKKQLNDSAYTKQKKPVVQRM
jgi:hypothetical protein